MAVASTQKGDSTRMPHTSVLSGGARSHSPRPHHRHRGLAAVLAVVLAGSLWGLLPTSAEASVVPDAASAEPAEAATTTTTAAAAPDLTKFQKVVLGRGNTLGEAMELTVAPDGRVFFITRAGDIQMYDPTDGSIEIIMLASQLDVWSGLEDGGLGITLDPGFQTNNHLYVYYAPQPKAFNANRLSRLTLTENATTGEVSIAKASEKVILHVGTQRNICCHSAGSLQFDGKGVLHLTTGDNTSSSDNGGFSPHDERPGRNDYDAQDSAGNTNDLRGKMLRVIPRADDLGDENPAESSPGMSYDIPDGNLFGEGGTYPAAKYPTADATKTRPEIYVMGLRNPYRLGTDPDSDAVYWGEVGPDSRSNDPGRGPRHQEEFNRTTEAMNGGWPYCGGEVGTDLTKQDFGGAYVDWDFATNRAKTNPDGSLKRFPCNDPTGMKGVNDSPHSNGLVDLPPMTNPWIPYSTSGPFKYPEVEGSTPTGAQVYRRSRNTNAKETAFPADYEGSVFISEMSRGWIKEVRTNADGSVASINTFMTGFSAPGDMEFGPDGSLYVLEYGSGFFSGSPDTKLVRVDYAINGSAPQVRVGATPSEGGVPLDVAFSSTGTTDPDGDALTYAWDFDGNGSTESTQANPTHRYTAAGDYRAVLTVTDATGKSATGQVTVNVGNTRPTLAFRAPVEGGFFSPGDDVTFDVAVTDREETVDCTKVTVSEGLGHDIHVHPLQSETGCTGTMSMSTSTDHGEDAHTYGVLSAAYADGGSTAGNAPLEGRENINLQPKRKQAEHANGRSGVSETGYDDKSGTRPGAGGIITGMGNGNHVSYSPMSLAGMRSISVTYSGSPAADAAIEVRAGAANGPVAARIPLNGGTNGLYFYKTVTGEITSRVADQGGRALFFVYTGGGEMNFDEARFTGTGIASNVAPFITSATATPVDGAAPLEVDFSATASDVDGEAITYTWDFGVAGTTDDTGAGQTVTYTYTAAGTYTATVTATDTTGKSSTRTVQVVVRRACATLPTADAGYELLFNGRDLTGWKQSGPGGFTVEGCEMTSFGGLGLLWNNTKQFADYSMKLQFKLSDDGDNSGVFMRFPDPGNDPFDAVNQGHEIQIKEGAATDEPQKTGSVYNFDREDARNARPVGQWNDYEIEVKGQTYVMTLNGVVVNRYTSDGTRGTTGFVGLQNHGNADSVAFRNIQIRELVVDEPFVNTVSVTPVRGGAPLEATFSAAGVDRQGDALTYEWDFGDGSATQTGGDTIKHTYTAEGSFTAAVVPVDADGTRGLPVKAAPVTVLTDPVPTASATPSCGIAPVEVAFAGSATDPQGQAVTYAWDFGVEGSTDDTSTVASPTYTYASPGTYTATLRVTDPDGNAGTTTVRVRALESGVCRAVTDLSSFFNNDGISTDTNPGNGNFDGGGWTYAAETLPAAVRDNGGSLVVSGVDHEFPSPVDGRNNNVEANGQVIPLPGGRFTELSILGAAHNGDVQQPATITYGDGSTSTVQLRFTDWAVSPKFGETIAADMPHRHFSGGDTGPRVYIWQQQVPLLDKDVASIRLPVEAKLHIFAISGVAPGEEPPCDQPRRSDEFDDHTLLDNCHWSIRRENPDLYKVGNGALSLTAGPGEYATTPNVITQATPAGDWQVTTKLTFDPTQAGQQAGLVVAGAGGSGFAKLMFVRKSDSGDEWIEFLKSSTPQNSFSFEGDWHTGGGSFSGPFLPGDFPTTFWLRLSSDGTDLTGEYSTDGETFTQVGIPRALAGIDAPRVGVMALRGDAPSNAVADFDHVRFAGEPVQAYPVVPIAEPTMTSCSRGDDFAAALATERWDGILRADPQLYRVADGNLELQTGPGELTEGSPNLILQSTPDGAYTAVTKLTLASTAEGQQAGLVLHDPSTSGYLKLAFVNKGGGNRWVEFLRNAGGNNDFSGNWHSGPGGSFGGPFLPAEFPETVYLRMSTADGVTFRGEYSVDGQSWLTAGDDRAGFGPDSFVGPYALRGPGSQVATAKFAWFGAAPERECEVNTAPVVTASATPTSGAAPLVVDFTADGTDADGDALTYTWDFGDNASTGGTPTGAAVSHTYTAAGTYTATVTATDPSGATATDTVQITVSGAQQGRTWVVDAVDSATSNQWVSADNGTSEVRIKAGDTVEWQFDQATMGHDLTSLDSADVWDPPVREYRDPHGAPIRHTFTKPGTYEYFCTLHGGTMRGTVVVEAAPQNTAPTVDPLVEPRTGPAPLYTHFEARATDADGDQLTYLWDFGESDLPDDTSTSSHAHHDYVDPGRYTASLRVSDGRGGATERSFEITVTGGVKPIVTADARPTTGRAPLNVVFGGGATDEQGGDLTFAWDFGVSGREDDKASSVKAGWTYTEAGTYAATLTVTDPQGNAGTDTVQIVVEGTPADPRLGVQASAAPSGGEAPLDVQFDTSVTEASTTAGEIKAFADGLATYPELTGTAGMVRGDGTTSTSVSVTGLKPNAAHMVHVHEEACSSNNGGPHFRFDESEPFAEANEIWPMFTTDAAGTGVAEVESDRRAGPKAVSIVIHDPDNPAKRIGCVDLVPTGLTYAWTFGDGEVGTGAAPQHTYTEAGIFEATVTVTDAATGDTATDTVEVVVGAGPDTAAPQTTVTAGPKRVTRSRNATFRFASSEPGSTFEYSLDGAAWTPGPATATVRNLRDGVHRLRVRATDAAGNTDATPAVRAWRVDTRGPVIRAAGPRGSTRDRTPTIRAVVRDAGSELVRRHLTLRVDGRTVLPRYDARADRMTWTARSMSTGRHTVRLVATDAAGNRTIRAWRFTVRR